MEREKLKQIKSIQLNHNKHLAHSNLGAILRDLGKLNEAELSLQQAIKIDPDFEQFDFHAFHFGVPPKTQIIWLFFWLFENDNYC